MRAQAVAGYFVALAACAMAAQVEAASPVTGPAAALRGRHAALSEHLRNSPLQQGLYLESAESPGTLRGDVYAVVDYPFATVSKTFTKSASWCEALILHLNVKFCQAELRGEDTVLSVAIGRKIDEPLDDTYQLEFAYSVTASEPGYTEIALAAREGPLDTRNYQISLEMVGLDDKRAFLHLRYSYDYGLTARLAMGAYLATSGSGKVGFTSVASESGGSPQLIGGLRGALERNTMRYYLALDAYLDALATPAPQRFEESIERWFTATERYARQLHEVERGDYLTMKRDEYLRQQAVP
jgi:hypothetical protein